MSTENEAQVPREEQVAWLIRERDEARAEIARLRALAQRLAAAHQRQVEDTGYCPACECHEHDKGCDVLAAMGPTE